MQRLTLFRFAGQSHRRSLSPDCPDRAAPCITIDRCPDGRPPGRADVLAQNGSAASSARSTRIPPTERTPPGYQSRRDLYLQLVLELHQPVFRYLHAMLGDLALAEDLTQDVFERAWRNLDRLHDTTVARSWVFAIAANAARAERRRGRLISWLPLSAASNHRARSDFPGEGAGGALDTLARLSDAEREVLLLVGYFGFTAVEAGPLMNCSPDAARKRWQRACARFRAEQEPDAL